MQENLRTRNGMRQEQHLGGKLEAKNLSSTKSVLPKYRN